MEQGGPFGGRLLPSPGSAWWQYNQTNPRERGLMDSNKKNLTSEELDRKIQQSHLKIQELQQRAKEEQDRDRVAMREFRESLGELKEAQLEVRQAQLKTEQAQLETERALRETDKFATKTLEAINKASGDFRNKWGRFMQMLVKGDLVKLLNSRGLQIEGIHPYKAFHKDGNPKWEYDLIAIHEQGAVVVEVKTMLNSSAVDYFLKKVVDFKSSVPFYKGKTVYGLMAYLDEDGAAKHAQNSGLFTVEALGAQEVAIITNPQDFVPRRF